MKKYTAPPVPKTSKAKAKIATIMREHVRGELHHGGSGKIVPKNRPDIAKAIALSSARRVTKGK